MPLKAITIHRMIFRIWRAKRFQRFLDLLKPGRQDTLIDIGGAPNTWTAHPPIVASIHVVDVRRHPFDPSEAPEHHIKVDVADGRELPFEDGQYDIAFSNSVIEHVGSWEDQQRFAAEMRRCADRIWCQTPARACPIEPHYMAPIIHWLPGRLQRRLIRWWTPWGWLSKPAQHDIDFMVDTTRLVTRREMRTLFPDCEILVERMLWVIPKSFIAVRRQTTTRS